MAKLDWATLLDWAALATLSSTYLAGLAAGLTLFKLERLVERLDVEGSVAMGHTIVAWTFPLGVVVRQAAAAAPAFPIELMGVASVPVPVPAAEL